MLLLSLKSQLSIILKSLDEALELFLAPLRIVNHHLFPERHQLLQHPHYLQSVSPNPMGPFLTLTVVFLQPLIL